VEIDKTDIDIQVANAKLGKQSAYNFLLDRYCIQLYSFQIKRLGKEFDAVDITIETFAKGFDKIHSYKETYVVSTWLITISKNIQIDKTRKKNATLHTQANLASDAQLKSVPDANPTPEDVLITKQNLTQLLRDIKLLKPAYQEVIQLRYFQEMSYSEIAQELTEPLSNIKVRLLRAKKLLAEIITKNNSL
jgi:RNA polymerase sigma-70 factor (ECF subfamily)